MMAMSACKAEVTASGVSVVQELTMKVIFCAKICSTANLPYLHMISTYGGDSELAEQNTSVADTGEGPGGPRPPPPPTHTHTTHKKIL